MATNNNLGISREELVAKFQATRVSKPKVSNPRGDSEVLTMFPMLKELLGTFKHSAIPELDIKVTKVAMFDKRSMTVLFSIEDINGDPLPMGIFSSCPTGRELDDKKHISLASLVDHLVLNKAAKAKALKVIADLDALMGKAIELDHVKKGYAEASNFQKYYKACFQK